MTLCFGALLGRNHELKFSPTCWLVGINQEQAHALDLPEAFRSVGCLVEEGSTVLGNCYSRALTSVAQLP